MKQGNTWRVCVQTSGCWRVKERDAIPPTAMKGERWPYRCPSIRRKHVRLARIVSVRVDGDYQCVLVSVPSMKR